MKLSSLAQFFVTDYSIVLDFLKTVPVRA